MQVYNVPALLCVNGGDIEKMVRDAADYNIYFAETEEEVKEKAIANGYKKNECFWIFIAPPSETALAESDE